MILVMICLPNKQSGCPGSPQSRLRPPGRTTHSRGSQGLPSPLTHQMAEFVQQEELLDIGQCRKSIMPIKTGYSPN